MPSRFLNNIKINDEYSFPNADGSADQIIKTDGAGQLSFVDQSTISAGNAEHVVVYAKNTSGSQINKGTPVYITGTVGATDTVAIAPADAGNASHMPAVGLLDDTLLNNEFGYVITGGFMDNITTDPIDGAQPASNDTVYVKAGGGLTLTKPTGSNLIQNVAKVGKVSGGNSGSLIVSSILRTNDVPNLTTGKIWVGSNTNTTESTVVHLDETNGRMGIGTTSPAKKLTIGGIGLGNTDGLKIEDPSNTAYGAHYSYDDGSTTVEIGGVVNNALRDCISIARDATRTITIDTSEKVGIGTTSPRSKLHVQGVTGSVPALGAAASAAQIGGPTYGTLFSTLTSGTGVIQQGRSDGNTLTFPLLINPNGGNVGIGTTNPSQRLEVNGDARFTGKIYTNAGELDSVGIVGKAIANGWAARYDSNNANYSGFFFDANNDAGMVLRDDAGNMNVYLRSDSNSYLNGGNVGIGTNSPAQKLHVIGNSEITGDIFLGRYIFHNDDTNTWLGFPLADTISFRTNGSDRMYITSSGNVGIGTTSPSSKLQVNGDLTVGDDSTVGSFINVIAAGASQDAGIRFGSESNTDSKAAIYTNTSNSDLHFDVTETTRMLIDSGTGNVGIGTTSPGAKLEVEQSNSSTNTVFLSNSYNNKGFRTGNSGYATFSGYQDANNTSSGGAYGALIGLNTFYNGTNFYNDNQYVDPSSILFKDGNILFHTNDISATGNFTPNERLRITKTGNVGIGTTSPVGKLDVKQAATNGNNSPFANPHVKLTATATADNQGFVGITTATSTADNYGYSFGAQRTSGGVGNFKINYHNNSSQGVNRFLIDQNGNVGIGETNPTSKLEVRSETATHQLVSLNRAASTTAAMYLGNDSGNNAVISSNNSDLIFGKDQSNTLSEWMRVTAAGNVGIGATSPSEKLHVKATSSSSSSMLYLENIAWATNMTTGIAFKNGANYAGPTAKIYTIMNGAGNQGGEIRFATLDYSGTNPNPNTTLIDRMIIDDNGNVGIGTTSASYKLDVAGDLRVDNGNVGSTSGDEVEHVKVQGARHFLKFKEVRTANDWDWKNTTFKLQAGVDSVNHQSIDFVADGSYREHIDIRTGNQVFNTRFTYDGKVGIGTTSPGEELEVNGTVKATATTDAYKGYIKQNVISYGADKTESTDYKFTSYNTTATVPTAQAYNRIVAAYSGRVKKVYMRNAGGSTPTATAVNFKTHINGVTSTATYAATVANTASANMTAYYEFADSDFTFNAGDLVGLLYQTTDGFGTASKTMGASAITITLEYNIT